MNDVAPQALPIWEQQYPGRFKAEIDALKAAGVETTIDREKLAQGQLSLILDWTLSTGERLELVADYPDTFPHFRPHVFLRSKMDPTPTRHLDPVGGNVCLLGRDPRQWKPSYTLAQLLSLQLEDALTQGGDEDPQGEPAEFWWNGLGLPESYILVDSSFQLPEAEKGTLLFRYIADDVNVPSKDSEQQKLPRIRGYIVKMATTEGDSPGTFSGPIPLELESSTTSIWIPWIRLDEPFLPTPPIGNQIQSLIDAHEHLRTRAKTLRCAKKVSVKPYCIISPSELAFGQHGTGWAVPVVYGAPKAFGGKKLHRGSQDKLHIATIPVQRAGLGDIHFRVPRSKHLENKRILLVGCGAIGAPLAIELARNGAGQLHLIDHDVITPGNSIRWPLGTSAWGIPKVNSLREHIQQEYPLTKVDGYQQAIGIPVSGRSSSDHVLLNSLISDVDLIVDASTNHGVTAYLYTWAERKNLPLISFFATPSLGGGVVARFSSDYGCPNCLEWAWETGEIEPPQGWGEEEHLIQPPGCSELTFVGAGYDLSELSLQAMRLLVASLDPGSGRGSIVHTLSLVDESGERCAPIWTSNTLGKHTSCPCSARRQKSMIAKTCRR